MPLQWNQQLATGVEDIDAQHQELIVIINNLETVYKSDGSAENVSETIDGLNKYVYEHFRTEEDIMHSYAYPSMEKHLLEHNYFKKKMIRLNFKPDAAESAPGCVLDFLHHWLVNHICTADKDLGLFIRNAFQG